MQLIQTFTKFILLIKRPWWWQWVFDLYPWGTVELIETEIGNSIGPQTMSTPACLLSYRANRM